MPIKYEVMFYFGMHQINPFVSPNKVVQVEVDREMEDNDIIKLALKELDSHPKTYTANVIKK